MDNGSSQKSAHFFERSIYMWRKRRKILDGLKIVLKLNKKNHVQIEPKIIRFDPWIISFESV